jgi:eukaryotic-like serine/threonine-protein kinase
MQDSSSVRPQSGGDQTGSRKPAEVPIAPPLRGDPPTVLTGRVDTAPLPSQSDQTPLAPKPGDRFEAFELARAIGVGGMGAVFLATDTRLQREVALKILPPEQSNDSEIVQRFYQEGRAAARLDHENIARVFTIGSDRGYHFIAFEYIEGNTLRQRVHDHGPLPIGEAINYTLQIAGALVHASERGVVHRDVKPSNIIVTPQGRAKLVDMGLARRFERGGDDGGLTQSGTTLGTFDYISPEQARDPRDVDVRGDLYSLGCTLFHMLTGRPPFPDGTVLQKLLQHQEEPPPDVRLLNPDVPDDLAAILVKLMAKDRERRYQTPELLVRDLLTLAGALGLRSLSPEGLVWMAPQGPPAWEKHLVWGLPAATLALVVGLLFWWGQPIEGPARYPDPGPSATPAPKVATNPVPVERRVEPRDSLVAAGPIPSPPVQPRPQPRDVEITAGDTLAAAIAREPSGSTLILTEDGPYLLPPSPAPATGRRDLTIRAAANVRPVIRLSRNQGAGAAADPALLIFGPGTVAIEGIEFQVEPGESDAPWAAIRGEGTDLSLKKCSFRRGTKASTSARISAVQIRPGAGVPDSPTPCRVDACHFDGGLVGLWVKGPAALQLRDCTFGPDGPAFLFDKDAGPLASLGSELALKHVSVQVGLGPVLRSTRTTLRAVVDDCVFATASDRDATLIEIDEPDRLAWKGKGNLYSGIATYLRPTGSTPGRGPINGFDAWADDPRAFREAISMTKEPPVWEFPDPSTPLARFDPSAGFALGTLERPSAEVGARRGPRGLIVSLDEGLAALGGFDLPTTKPELLAGRGPELDAPSRPAATNPMPKVDAPPTKDVVPAPNAPQEIRPMDRGGDETMPIAPMDRNPPDIVPAVGDAAPNDARPPNDRPAPDAPPKDAASGQIRTTAAFVAALDALGPRGGTLKIAPDADLAVPSSELKGPGRVIIQADDGVGRPVLRFRPSRLDTGRTGRRLAMFGVRAGSLELQGVDVVLESASSPERGDWCAFRVWAGAELTLSRSTVTVEGRSPRSAFAFVPSGEDDVEPGAVAALTSSAQIRVTDCLIRGGGDLLDVAPGRRLDAEFTNVVAAAGGSLIHGHGLARGQTPEPLRIVLRQVSALLEGGLAYLESAPGEPELPVVDVLARDLIVSTDGDGAPLVRIDGQEDLDSLRDRVKWDGSGVHYHRIEVYRRDQTARPGTLPLRFDRPSWDVAVAPRDISPFHGDVRFIKPWEPARSPATMTREDVALDSAGPASTAGPDTRRIPPAPAPTATPLAPK